MEFVSEGGCMPDSEPHIEYYKGFELIAKLHQGRFQGCAMHRITKKKISIDGAAVSGIVSSLKELVDADVAENMVFYRQSIIDKHRKFLVSIEKSYLGQGVVSHFARAKHCFKCKGPVNNAFDLECKACGWIICSYCGACGCGHKSV